MDIDLLGRTDNSVETIVDLCEISLSDVTDDGMAVVFASFIGGAIREDADYAGVCTIFSGRVDE